MKSSIKAVRRLLMCIFALAGLASCAMMDHRDYWEEMEASHDGGMFRPYADFDVVQGDASRPSDGSAYMGRVPATASMREESRWEQSLERELRVLESRLTDLEHEQYQRVKGRLGNIHQRIYYLQLEPSERGVYLNARGIASTRYYTPQEAFPQEVRPQANSWLESSLAP